MTFQIAWQEDGTTRSMTQNALIVNPAGGLGPLIKSLSPMAQTITSSTATVASVSFTTSSAAAVHRHADNDKRSRNALGTQARQLRNLAKRLNNNAVIDTVGSLT